MNNISKLCVLKGFYLKEYYLKGMRWCVNWFFLCKIVYPCYFKRVIYPLHSMLHGPSFFCLFSWKPWHHNLVSINDFWKLSIFFYINISYKNNSNSTLARLTIICVMDINPKLKCSLVFTCFIRQNYWGESSFSIVCTSQSNIFLFGRPLFDIWLFVKYHYPQLAWFWF